MIGLMNGGISGYSLGHSDVGGYTVIDQDGIKYVRTKEVLYRWIEMNAFSDVVMRTHPSNKPGSCV